MVVENDEEGTHVIKGYIIIYVIQLKCYKFALCKKINITVNEVTVYIKTNTLVDTLPEEEIPFISYEFS